MVPVLARRPALAGRQSKSHSKRLAETEPYWASAGCPGDLRKNGRANRRRLAAFSGVTSDCAGGQQLRWLSRLLSPDPDPHHFDGNKDGIGCVAGLRGGREISGRSGTGRMECWVLVHVGPGFLRWGNGRSKRMVR